MKRTASQPAIPGDFLDRALLRRLAGGRAFERGEGYFRNGQVGAVVERGGKLTVRVDGTRTYRVALWSADDEVDWSCTCPVGHDGGFCKHCVAVGLAWLEAESSAKQASTGTKPGKKAPVRQVTIDDVRAWLVAQTPQVLADLLMQQVAEDDGLRRWLLMQVAGRDPGRLDLATYRRAIDEAIDVRGFVDYREAWDYVRGIDGAIDGIEALYKRGHAAEAVALAEHALAAVEQAIESVDDSDGGLGEILERLQVLHHRACRKARPDPETLARRLFAWELRSEWDVFHGAAQTYADVFGKKGLAVYRQLAEAAWREVPVLGPGGDRNAYGKRFRITSIMEALARHDGDVEARVAIKQRDLSSAWSFLQIAEIYQGAGRHEAALDWAERGCRAFPERTDPRLREFLAQAYHRARRHDEAMALAWAGFAERPCLQTYGSLLEHAGRCRQRPAWRERALAHLRQIIAGDGQSRRVRGRVPPGIDHSLLVEIFLWEKNVQAAWDEATAHGCSERLWMTLAASRAKTHPQDALPIYQRQISPTLDRTSNEAYREAVVLLRTVRGLMEKLGRQAEFPRYLARIRAEYMRKRNFIKLLDHVKW